MQFQKPIKCLALRTQGTGYSNGGMFRCQIVAQYQTQLPNTIAGTNINGVNIGK